MHAHFVDEDSCILIQGGSPYHALITCNANAVAMSNCETCVSRNILCFAARSHIIFRICLLPLMSCPSATAPTPVISQRDASALRAVTSGFTTSKGGLPSVCQGANRQYYRTAGLFYSLFNIDCHNMAPLLGQKSSARTPVKAKVQTSTPYLRIRLSPTGA